MALTRSTITSYFGLSLFAAYNYFDVTTSANAGIRNADRTLVYVFNAVILFFFAMIALKSRGKGIHKWDVHLISLIAIVLFSAIFGSTIDYWRFLIIFIHIITIVLASNYLKNIDVDIYVIFFLSIYSLAFLYSRWMFLSTYNVGFYAVNYAYHILVLYPLTFLMTNNMLKRCAQLVICVLIVISLKRGAIIALGLGLIFTSNIRSFIVSSFSIKGLFAILVVLVLIFCGSGSDLLDILTSRFETKSLADGSGRSTNYLFLINSLKFFGVKDWIFGKGIGSTVLLLGTGAHNEFLEFLYSYGLLGLGWLLIFLSKLKMNLKVDRKVTDYWIASKFLLISVAIMCAVSGLIFMSYMLHVMVFIKKRSRYA